MRRIVMVVVLSVCWAAIAGADVFASTAPTTQQELLAKCEQVQRSLNQPVEQHALAVLNVALTQSQPLTDGIDLSEVLRQVKHLTAYVVKSDTFYTWSGSEWVGSHRSTYGYSGTREIQEIEQTWSGSAWVNAEQDFTTYNGDGTVSSMKGQEWSGSSWVNTDSTAFSYAGGMTSTITMFEWSGSAWSNHSRSMIYYTSGKMDSTVAQLWQTGAWVNVMKQTYTYTGDEITTWVIQNWETSAWVNAMRWLDTYVGGLLMQSVTQTWNDSDWEDTNKHEYTYSGSHEILDVYSIFSGVWIAMDADTTKWSGENIIEIVYNHTMGTSVSRTQFTYDGNDNNTLKLSQSWTGDEWLNTSREVYVYEVALAVEVGEGRVPAVFELEQNYPNPFNPITAIRYSLRRPSQVEITVFNVLGQEVRTLESGMQPAGSYETTWNGTDQAGSPVASGVYFYRIKAGDFTETRKMVLLK